MSGTEETQQQETGAPEVTEPPADAPPPMAPPSEAELLRNQLEQAQARLREVSKAYTELNQEMRAFRERMEHQSKIKLERQAFEVVRAFFDPVMSLRRSTDHPGADVEVLVEGLRMVQHQFMEALRKLGLEEVPGVGASFDAKLHEPLAFQPVDDPAQDGKVVQLVSAGFSVNGKVLEAARVVLGKYEAPAGEA